MLHTGCMNNSVLACPCGSEHHLDACCGQFHRGAAAPTAQALMRSRFTAYVLGNWEYLLQTWHPDFRPVAINLDPDQVWTRLRILETHQGGSQDHVGTVHFRAHYRVGNERDVQEEKSNFVRVGDRWLYTDGVVA